MQSNFKYFKKHFVSEITLLSTSEKGFETVACQDPQIIKSFQCSTKKKDSTVLDKLSSTAKLLFHTEEQCIASIVTFTVLCISEVIRFLAATITSWHFLLAKWELTLRAYFSKSVVSPFKNCMSFRAFSNSSVDLITWEEQKHILD